MNKILIKDCDKRDFNSYYFNTNDHFFRPWPNNCWV